MATKKRHNYNFNYILVFYDIGEKRVGKVFKICKKYLVPFQKSVFRGEITPANIIKLKLELEKVIDPDYDFVTFMKFIGEHQIFEENIGIDPNPEYENFI